MIVVSKKKIVFFLSVFFVFIFVCNIVARGNNINTSKKSSVETVALPVTNKVIVLDAGHGIPDEGAQSSQRNNRGTNKFKNCT